MRIAVLVYGRLNKCGQHYENIIHNIGRQHTIDFFMSSDNSPEDQLQEFLRFYKPILFINEKIHYSFDLGKYPGKHEGTSIHNMTCHFINKARAFMLLEYYIQQHMVEYNIVLSIRVDLVFYSPFHFKTPEENTIYIPSGNDHVEKAINDQVAYGKLDVMKKYNNIILYCVPLLEHGISIPHPETLTFANICLHGINIRRFNIVYSIHR